MIAVFHRAKTILLWWFAPSGAVVLAVSAYFLLAPEKPVYGTFYVPKATVFVSSYTRNGTIVSSHNRAAPGERTHANSVNRPIIMHNAKLKRNYEYRRRLAFCAATFVGLLSFGLLYIKPPTKPIPPPVPATIQISDKPDSETTLQQIPKPRTEGFFMGSELVIDTIPRISHPNSRPSRFKRSIRPKRRRTH